jgi:hypothetical protein
LPTSVFHGAQELKTGRHKALTLCRTGCEIHTIPWLPSAVFHPKIKKFIELFKKEAYNNSLKKGGKLN